MKFINKILIISIFFIFFIEKSYSTNDEIYKKIDVFSEVLDKINNEFVDDVDQSEIMEHVKLLSTEGFENEIASYTYSSEYLTAFGIDQVPYTRGSNTMQGGSTINYTRTNAFDAGYAGYDGAQKGSRLLKSLTTGSVPDIMQRKGVGNGGALTISWSSRKQIGANRRVAQKSVVSQTSMSSTIKSILSQGGKILSITKA